MRDLNAGTKPKLAIVSTYDELCGIAGYSRALAGYLAEDFEIEVFDLDQFLMRSASRTTVQRADAQVRDICDRLGEFDAVNIQLEYGTLGYAERDILRRFKMLVEAAPHLSVTFHTILPSEPFPGERIRRHLTRAKVWKAYATLRDHRQAKSFRSAIYATLREAQKSKPVHVIVHTARDARAMTHFNGFEHVHHHPLAFLTEAEVDRLQNAGARANYPSLVRLPDGAKIIGLFGFVSEYKGIHTALKAMNLLPDSYHLAIFGGLHPGEIRPPERGEPAQVHPYVERLLGESHVDETLADALGTARLSIDLAQGGGRGRIASPRDLRDRVHFMGVQSDDALAAAMGAVDVVALPYFEVGQASSGPMSIAAEMGAPIVASRTQAFMQFDKYNPGRASFFDVGNHLELAQRIRDAVEAPVAPGPLTYTTETNRRIYVAANRPDRETVA